MSIPSLSNPISSVYFTERTLSTELKLFLSIFSGNLKNVSSTLYSRAIFLHSSANFAILFFSVCESDKLYELVNSVSALYVNELAPNSSLSKSTPFLILKYPIGSKNIIGLLLSTSCPVVYFAA